jgi:kanamycin kinase
MRSSPSNEVYRLGYSSRSLILKTGPQLEREYERLKWLEGRLPAPRPIGFASRDGKDALLMSAIEGRDLADLCAVLSPQTIITRLASALRIIHSTTTAGWPFGGGGVLVHGDACLPNFLYHYDQLSGYIDLGDLALDKPEIDLAAAVWSLQYNIGPGYGPAFLHEYGIGGANEEMAERLRLAYEGTWIVF